MKKKIISVYMIIYVVFISVFNVYHVDTVQAAEVGLVGQIVAYFLGTVGALDLTTGGAISGVTSTVKDRIAQYVANQLGTGIYTDSNGNYVFSGDATQGLYDALYSNSGNNGQAYRVISDFGGFDPRNALLFGYSPYVPATFWYFPDNYEDETLAGKPLLNWYNGDYLIYLTQDEDDSYIQTNLRIIRLNDVAYLNFTDSTLDMHTANGSLITGRYNLKRTVTYNKTKGTFGNEGISINAYGKILSNSYGFAYDKLNFWKSGESSFAYRNRYFGEADKGVFPNVESIYNNFPMQSFWSNKSIILGLTDSGGMYGFQNQNGLGVQVSNNYYTLPSISEKALTTNNWNSIYNDYVNSVSDSYNVYIDNGGTVPAGKDFNYDKLHNYMSHYSDLIVTAVENGTDSIETVIQSSNEWLKRIYERLGDISTELGDIEDKVTDIEYDTGYIPSISAGIGRIESQLSSELLQLQQTYVLLGQILSAIQGLGSGGGGGGVGDHTVNTWNDLTFEIDNLPDEDVLDIFDKFDVLVEILKTVMPFCYIPFIGAIINGFAARPITPVFDVPMKMTTNLNYEGTVHIDLTEFEDVRDLIVNLQCIAFVIWLIYMTFALFRILMTFLS